MSYINDALRKAQKEKEKRYGNFSGVDTLGAGVSNRAWTKRAAAAAALILFVATGLAVAFWSWNRPDPSSGTAPAASIAKPSVAGASPVRSLPEAAEASVPVKEDVPDEDSRPAAPRVWASADIGTQTAGEAEARYGEALSAQRSGNLAKAEILYQRALASDPDHVRALNNLGVVYLTRGKREKAVMALGRAVVLEKDYADPYYNLACLYARTNELDESLWYLKMAARLDGKVIEWAKRDADLRRVVASPEFKKLTEGKKN